MPAGTMVRKNDGCRLLKTITIDPCRDLVGITSQESDCDWSTKIGYDQSRHEEERLSSVWGLDSRSFANFSDYLGSFHDQRNRFLG